MEALGLCRKVFKTSRSYNYTYFHRLVEQESETTPTLLFIHGFPDSSHLWLEVISRIIHIKLSIVAIDILGLGETDKPADPSVYNSKSISNDLKEILDHEKIERAFVIGHDVGSGIASRLYLFHPERVAGLCLLNVPYRPPGQTPFNLQNVNDLFIKLFGYPAWSYWEFCISTEAPKLMDNNVERFYEIMHGDKENWMKEIFGTPGNMKLYLEGKMSRAPLKSYSIRYKDVFSQQMEKYGFEAPLCWYKVTTQNFNYQVEKHLPANRLRIDRPVLFLSCSEDAACRGELIRPAQEAGYLPDLETHVLDCGHWSPLEKPQEIAEQLESFLVQKYFTASRTE